MSPLLTSGTAIQKASAAERESFLPSEQSHIRQHKTSVSQMDAFRWMTSSWLPPKKTQQQLDPYFEKHPYTSQSVMPVATCKTVHKWPTPFGISSTTYAGGLQGLCLAIDPSHKCMTQILVLLKPGSTNWTALCMRP